jgi:hypothetical protein
MKFLLVMLNSKPCNFHGKLISYIYFRNSLRLSAASSSVAGLFVCRRPLRVLPASSSVGGHLYVCRRPSVRLSADICTSVGGHLYVCRRTSVRLSADICTSVGGHLYVCRRPSVRLSADICTSVGGHLYASRRPAEQCVGSHRWLCNLKCYVNCYPSVLVMGIVFINMYLVLIVW